MEDLLIMFIFGFIIFILGILLLKRDSKLFENSVVTVAKLVNYFEYISTEDKYIKMYTAEFEYILHDGTMIRTKEQSGSSYKKYPIGTELNVYYSKKKPDLFIVCGDNSRKYIFYGMIIVGVVLMVLFGYMALNGN